MIALHSGSPGIGQIPIIVPLLAIIIVIFWRLALKIILGIAAILLIIFITSGAVGLMEGLQHAIR
jgi:hypothetical protein